MSSSRSLVVRELEMEWVCSSPTSLLMMDNRAEWQRGVGLSLHSLPYANANKTAKPNQTCGMQSFIFEETKPREVGCIF